MDKVAKYAPAIAVHPYWRSFMDKVAKYAPAIAVTMVAIGLLGYLFALALAAFFPDAFGGRGAQLAAWFTSATAQNVGIPCAATAAFAIVAVLLKAFPPAKDANGQLSLKAFGLEFSGPSGPITLWLLCFMGFVIALKLLRV
jgi:hypothetical protein